MLDPNQIFGSVILAGMAVVFELLNDMAIGMDLRGLLFPRSGKTRNRRSLLPIRQLNPGRSLAADLPPNARASTELEQIIADFFAGKTVPTITPEEAVTAEEGEEGEGED